MSLDSALRWLPSAHFRKISPSTRPLASRLAAVLEALRDVLGPDLVGAYLHGSAVLGGLRPHSDLDVLAVAERRMTRPERASMIARLLAIRVRTRPRLLHGRSR